MNPTGKRVAQILGGNHHGPQKPHRRGLAIAAAVALTVGVAGGGVALKSISVNESLPSAATDQPTSGSHYRQGGLTVRVAQGTLQGTAAQGARAFRDIPYAAPPIYNLRFAPPQPPSPWIGMRPAAAEGPACIQFQPTGIKNSTPTNENCLNLDVYTPANASRGADRPVVFWMHGGGFTQGTGVIYGGQRFASLTGDVFVSINYRLGALGYLALPQLTARSRDGSGDYGLLDEIAALKWVRQNIGAFGGNPRNITVDGQSAGAASVCDMLASPMASGMFQRAIIESGPCNNIHALSLSAAYRKGQQFAAAAGCTSPATVASCLTTSPPGSGGPAWIGNLVAAEQKVVINSPVYGTPVLPVDPEQAILSGKFNKVPVIVGDVYDDNKLFDIPGGITMTPAQYTVAIDKQFGANAAAVLAHYQLAKYRSPFYAYAQLGSDSGFVCHSYYLANQLASQVPTYEEEFNDPTSPTLFGFQPSGIDMSNAHSAELAYLWNFTLGSRPLTRTELTLGKQMDRYWGAFARRGDPNTNHLVKWPAVTTSAHPVIDLRPTGNTISATAVPTEHNCGFWATIEPMT